MGTDSKTSWIQNLWDRKVPQYLGTYLAVGFGLLQFLEFMVSRYDLGDKLVDKYLLVWIALVPAIAVSAYFSHEFRTPSGRGRLKLPKLFIVCNIILGLFLGGFFFNGSAKSQGEIIEVTNEDGENISAVVPSKNKVKSLAIFQFENITKDQTLDWWGIAFSSLLTYNLEQRPEFYSYSTYSLFGYYNFLGLELFKVPNLGMQREIAQKSRNDYFTRISYEITDESFEFKGNLYSSKDGKAVVEIDVVDTDPYRAIDLIKEQIVENIPNAFQQTENQIDLPASTLISSNKEALRLHTASRTAFYKDPSSLEGVVDLAKKSVETDPTCSVCHFYLGDPLYGLGKRDEAISAVKNAIRYGVSLPDRMQFGPKAVLYSITNNLEAYIKLQEVRRRMFPYDFSAYQQLLNVYLTNYGIDSAKVLMQEAIENGNIERGLLELFDLEVDNEEYAKAEETLERFAKEFPERDVERMRYANLYEKQGKTDKAKSFLLEEETLDPLDPSIQTRLAYIDFKNLDLEKAYQRIADGMQQSSSLTDSIAFLSFEQFFLHQTGQISKALISMEEIEILQLKKTPKNRLILRNFNRKVDMYQSTGNASEITELIDEIDKYSPESRYQFECASIINTLEKEYERFFSDEDIISCRDKYDAIGEGFGEYMDLIYFYSQDEYDKCVALIDADIKKYESLLSNKFFLANIYEKAGALQKAIGVLKTAIAKKPGEPDYYYKLAALLENEDPVAAKNFLETALAYWSEADDDFRPLQKARKLADRLSL